MILYHGSKAIVEKPVYGFGKDNNDYGRGFYCTEDIELAKEWACTSADGGYVNQYEFADDKIAVFDLNEYKLITWLTILVKNRDVRYSSPVEKRAAEYLVNHFSTNTDEYDVIKGYRADDSFFSYTRAFLANTLSYEQLQIAIRLGNLGQQIFLKSKKSFDQLRFLCAEEVDGEIYYPKRILRENKAREDFYALLEQNEGKGIHIRDIIDKEMSYDELCL